MFLFPQSLYDGINKNNDSAIMISGFKIIAGMYVAMIAPPPEATNINGNIFPTIFKSTLPERKILMHLLVLKELANLFVPKATDGGKPTASNAGVEISPPHQLQSRRMKR